MTINKFAITASSNVGLVRKNNEDMILVRNKYVRDENYRTVIELDKCDRFVMAVADGMGGYDGGEVASQEVLASLHFYIGDLPAKLTATQFCEAMMEWVNSTNVTINTKGELSPDKKHGYNTYGNYRIRKKRILDKLRRQQDIQAEKQKTIADFHRPLHVCNIWT